MLPDVAGEHAAALTERVAAAAAIDLTSHDLVVIASPHGASTGVYVDAAGDLAAFGPRGIEVDAAGEPSVAQAVAEGWGHPLLDERVDHGIVVPLRLLALGRARVVALAFADGMEPRDAVAGARRLAEALEVTAFGGRVAFVASANLSPGLSDRAPVPSAPGAAEADAATLDALRTGPGEVLGRLPDLARAASCGAGPLAAFGLLFPDRACDVLAYEHPFGVGYAVATTS